MSDPMRWPSRPLLMALLVAVMFAGACGAEPAAFAGGAWTRPIAGQVLVAYGETCPAPGGSGTRTHQGVDLACAEGETAVACEGGTVAFAGPVPADSGGRVLAVTVTGDDGLRLTYMPLATAAVAAGRRVEAGSAIGAVAAQGDSSSAAPHLHLSVRRGEAYLDPAGMLAGAAGGSTSGGTSAGPGSADGAAQPAAPEVEARVGSSGAPASAGAPASQGSAAHASAGEVAPAAAQAGVLATLAALRAAPAVSPPAAVRAVTGRISLLAPAPARAGLLVPLPHATGLAAIAGSLSSLERAAMLAASALVVGLAGLACAWRSLYRVAGTAATAATVGALAPATTTPAGRA